MSEEVQRKEEAQGRQDSDPIPASWGGPMLEVGVLVGPSKEEAGETPQIHACSRVQIRGFQILGQLRGASLALSAEHPEGWPRAGSVKGTAEGPGGPSRLERQLDRPDPESCWPAKDSVSPGNHCSIELPQSPKGSPDFPGPVKGVVLNSRVEMPCITFIM